MCRWPWDGCLSPRWARSPSPSAERSPSIWTPCLKSYPAFYHHRLLHPLRRGGAEQQHADLALVQPLDRRHGGAGLYSDYHAHGRLWLQLFSDAGGEPRPGGEQAGSPAAGLRPAALRHLSGADPAGDHSPGSGRHAAAGQSVYHLRQHGHRRLCRPEFQLRQLLPLPPVGHHRVYAAGSAPTSASSSCCCAVSGGLPCAWKRCAGSTSSSSPPPC